MAALVWLLIPVIGGLVAALWSSWAARRRTGTGGVQDAYGVRRYEAFRAAMERPTRAPRPGWFRWARGRARSPRPAPVSPAESAAGTAKAPSPAPADG